MDSAGSVDEGHLIIFDRTQEKPWEERIWRRQAEQNVVHLTVGHLRIYVLKQNVRIA